jgi:hypothetical protein
MFYCAELMRKHVREEHEMDVDDYVDKYEKFETRAAFHSCLVCGADMKRNFGAIRAHLTREHDGLSMTAYEGRHGLKNYEVEGRSEEPSLPPTTNEERAIQTPQREEKKSKYWHDVCELKCQICRRQTLSSELLKHVAKAHKMSESQYNQSFGTSDTTSKEFYACKICETEIPHRMEKIRAHLSSHHDMAISMYGSLFHEKEDSNLPNEDKVAKEKKESTPDRGSGASTESGPASDGAIISDEDIDDGGKQDEDDVATMSFDQWKRGNCEFACSACEYKSVSSLAFWPHCRKVHELTIAEYKSFHGNPCSINSKWECDLCFRVMRHEEGSLKLHAEKRHEMSMKEMYDVCRKKKEGKSESLRGTAAEELVNADDGSQHTMTFDQWKNACVAQCKACKWKTTNVKAMSVHIIKKHGMKMARYRAKYGSYMAKLRRHNCTICGSRLLQQSQILNNHVVNVHNLESLAVYYDRYITKQKQESPEKKKGEEIDSRATSPSATDDCDDWMEARVYKCGVCDYETIFKERFEVHLAISHSMKSVLEHDSHHDGHLAGRMVHSCRICASFVPQNREEIKLHLRGQHGFASVGEYYKEHVRYDALSCVVKREPEADPQSCELSKIETAQYDAWRNACWATCAVCDWRTKHVYSFSGHIKSAHGIADLVTYRKKYGEEIEKVTLTCAVCGASVPQKYASLRSHFLNTHKYASVLDYYIEHVLAKKEHKKPGPEKVKVSKSTGRDDDVFIIDIAESATSETKKPSFLEDVSPAAAGRHEKGPVIELLEDWCNKCRYRCKICNLIFRSSNYFSAHIFKEHNMKGPQYQLKYGDRMTEKVELTCRICEKRVNQNDASMYCHFKSHKLTIRSYYETYILGRDNTKCEDSKKIKVEKAVKSRPKEKTTRHKTFMLTKGNEHLCLICETPVPSDAFSSHLRDDHDTDELLYQLQYGAAAATESPQIVQKEKPKFEWNQCCADCGGSRKDVNFHCTSDGCDVQKNTHRCLLCGVAVVFSLENVSAHLNDHHDGRELAEYEQQFGKALWAQFDEFKKTHNLSHNASMVTAEKAVIQIKFEF